MISNHWFMWSSSLRSTVGSNRLEHGCRLMYDGIPSLLGLGFEDSLGAQTEAPRASWPVCDSTWDISKSTLLP